MTLSRHSIFAVTFALAATFAMAQTADGKPTSSAPMPAFGDHGKSVDGKPLASPAATATVTLAGQPITINYNTPSLRGRHLGGPEIVPYGKVWRTGANPATSFVTAVDLKIGTLKVPAGSYTLYTLPAAPGTPWLLILNKQTGQWGTVYDQAQDLGRTPLKSRVLPAPQELMSISFEDTKPNSTELHIRWETTDEFIKVEATK